jgi:hypothetical protein
MTALQAPKAKQRKGLTASQWLYREYVVAKRGRNWRRMKSAEEGLVSICIHACGSLRPFWSPPTPPEGVELSRRYANFHFHFDGIGDRRQFAETFVRWELRRGMSDTEGRHIGRRCRLRLIDEIRSESRREWGFGRKSSDEYQAALQRVRHLHCVDDLWRHIKHCCPEWRDATNVSIARDWYRSEAWIRKLRKRLATQLWPLAENDEQRKALALLRLKPDGVRLQSK